MNKKGTPPVWMMVKEAIFALGDNATRKTILRSVLQKYPGTKSNTIGCQTTICTVNNPVRVQFAQNGKPRTTVNQYDFLFQTPDRRLVKYSPKKHGRWIIGRGKNGALVIQRLRGATANESRGPQLHILFCGSPTENHDYAYLSDIAENGGADKWSSVKSACTGDRVVFYTVQERRAFMASGWILKDAKATNDPSDYPYRAKIGAVRLLSTPVPISLLKHKFPDWGWPRFTRNITTVPQGIAQRLWALIHKVGEVAPAPAPEKNGEVNARSRTGGGFGNATDNKLVEAAAIKAVTQYLERKKYKVKSRESENIGYDLDARKGKELLHAEVKGNSGDGLSFIITQNEIATARIDPLFKLFVVNQARTKNPVIASFQGRDLDRLFSLTAISYSAQKR